MACTSCLQAYSAHQSEHHNRIQWLFRHGKHVSLELPCIQRLTPQCFCFASCSHMPRAVCVKGVGVCWHAATFGHDSTSVMSLVSLCITRQNTANVTAAYIFCCRGQGVGTAVMQSLLDTPAAAHTDVYLTTISRTMPFYHKAGFRELERRHTPRYVPQYSCSSYTTTTSCTVTCHPTPGMP